MNGADLLHTLFPATVNSPRMSLSTPFRYISRRRAAIQTGQETLPISLPFSVTRWLIIGPEQSSTSGLRKPTIMVLFSTEPRPKPMSLHLMGTLDQALQHLFHRISII